VVGLTVAPVEVPVAKPLSATICGLLLAPSVKATFALREPATVGRKRIVAVQLAPAARLVPQVLVEIRKSDAFVPPTVMLLIASAEDPLFVSVMTLGPPVCPTATLFQLKLVGLAEAVPEPPLLPVPESETTCGLLATPSVNCRLAVLAPAALGLKVIVTVQLAPDARVPPHVLLEITKSAALVPDTAMLLIVIVAALPFCSVATLVPPLAPTANDPHARLVGLTVTLPLGEVPSPERATFCVPAASTNARLAVRVLVVVGAKRIVAVQLAEAARVVPHVFE